jgi:D-3-phosphoglycerate dehydrogenase
MKVLIADSVSETAMNLLKDSGLEVYEKTGMSEEELVQEIPEYAGVIVRSGAKITKKVLDAAKKLKIVGRAGVGVDNIDCAAAKELGIAVENTPTGNTNAAAEHTISLMILLSKHIVHSNETMKQGKWDRKNFEGTELKGKTLGLIGFGNVGKKVAKVALALEMRVLVYDPFIDEIKLTELGANKVEFDEIIHASNMISKKQFDEMKTGIRILNVARGGVIDENALLGALESGKVAAAGLDVYNEEPPMNRKLIEHKKVIATPHLGASTIEAQENVAIDVAEQIIFALKNGEIKNCVNGITELKK